MLIVGLASLRIADRDQLAAWRKYAVLIAAIASAWITPTTDVFHQLFVGLLIYGLYEVGLLVVSVVSADGREPSTHPTFPALSD